MQERALADRSQQATQAHVSRLEEDLSKAIQVRKKKAGAGLTPGLNFSHCAVTVSDRGGSVLHCFFRQCTVLPSKQCKSSRSNFLYPLRHRLACAAVRQYSQLRTNHKCALSCTGGRQGEGGAAHGQRCAYGPPCRAAGLVPAEAAAAAAAIG